MNLDRELFLAYVEEDNTQRAYFRVHPMLTVGGPAAEEGKQLWPDDGCLRIVPDRGEQHTFKDRMRLLNGWCVVDLTAFQPEANKIRSNKNYRPDRGETNHYILYSDAVHPVPDRIFHQVFSGKPEESAALAERAVTPSFFIKDEEMFYGPVKKDQPAVPAAAEPMEARFFEIEAPDGQLRDFICVQAEYDSRPQSEPVARLPRKKPEAAETAAAAAPAVVTEPAAAPAEPAAAANEQKQDKEPAPQQTQNEVLPVGQALKILDEKHTYEETITRLNAPVSGQANLLKGGSETIKPIAPAPQAKLGGTPLRRGTGSQLTTQPRNRTQDVVQKQMWAQHYEPPAENLPRNAALVAAQNPVESAERALQQAWQVTDARDRMLESILTLDGIEPALERRLAKRIGVTDLQKAIQEHIGTLEAERLKVLVELDKAKADTDAYRASVVASARQKLQNELTGLDERKQSLTEALSALKDEVNQQIALREELLKRNEQLQKEAIPETVARLLADSALSMPMPLEPVRLVSVAGEPADKDALLARMAKVYRSAGLERDDNRSLAMLLVLGLCDRVGIAGEGQAAWATLLRNIASAMGWDSSIAIQCPGAQRPLVSEMPVDGTPLLLASAMPECAPSDRFTRFILSVDAGEQTGSAAYRMGQWPVLSLSLTEHVPVYRESDVKPVSAASLTALAGAGSLPDEEIDRVLKPVLALVQPMSGEAMIQLRSFVRAAADLMEGGLQTACDWAVMLWVIPAINRNTCDAEKVRLALTEYPMATAMFGV